MEPIYVEASVVADELMYKAYGEQTDDYLITILNQVGLNFQSLYDCPNVEQTFNGLGHGHSAAEKLAPDTVIC